MKIKLNNNNLYILLLIWSIIVPYSNNYELTFFSWLLILCFGIQRRYSISIIKCVIPYFIIVSIAILVGLFKNDSFYFMIRDITYLIKPIFGFLLGYQLFKKIKFNTYTPFDWLTIIGLILASIHTILIFYAIGIKGARTIADIRFYSGYFSDFEIYIFCILLFKKYFKFSISPKFLTFATYIIGFSAFMYLARTNFIQFGILFLGLKGFLSLSKKTIILYTTILFTGILGYGAIITYNPNRNGEGLEGFLYKLKVAPFEPFKTYINRNDYKDFNDNYRSYENIQTVRQMTNDGVNTLIFGKGIGSKVDLKQEVLLGDMYLRYISILHNGFMIVFLKSGLLGLVVYLFTIIYFFKNPKSSNVSVKHINLIFVATGIFLLISNWVFLGFYNLTESKSILIGFLIAYRELLLNEKYTNYTPIS